METLGLNHYLVLSALLFGIGVIGVLVRRNAIMVLMCLELIFNIFTITVAAAEAAIGLGLVIAVFRNTLTVNVDEIHLLKG